MRQDLKLSDGTAHNRRLNLLTFLASGIEKLLLRNKVKFVALEPESYDDEQLTKFFGAYRLTSISNSVGNAGGT